MRGWRGFLALLLALGALLASVGTATAQDGDPYGGTTTTVVIDPRVVPTCTIGLGATLSPGQTATARVTNVPFGGTVRILLGGVEAGRGTAPVAGQSAGRPVLFEGEALRGQATVTTLDIRFTVPRDLAPGRHLLTAVGANFTVRCGPNPDGTVDVLAAEEVAGEATDEGTSDSGGPSALPATGIAIALLLVVAIAVLLVGRAFLAASRRREATERQAAAVRRRRAEYARRQAELIDDGRE